MRPRSPLCLALACTSTVLLACVPDGSLLEGRACPCAPNSGFVCVDGVCVRGEPTDAGGRDAALADAAQADASQVDAGDGGTSDSGTADAGDPDGGGDDGPPPTPTDCWRQPTPCDWSGDFTFVEGDQDVIADLGLSSNPTFSPDGCRLFFSDSRVMHVAERAGAGSPFVDLGPIEGVDQASSENSKASVSPDGLQLFFTSNRTDGEFNTIHRASRAVPLGPWGVVEEVTTLTFPGLDNWDGMLAPHGLRYYWSPNREDGQGIFVGERDSLDAPFRAGVAVAELAADGAQAEPAVSADGRVIVFVNESPGSPRELVYATRPHWRAPFSAPLPVPGERLADGAERESTVSPDACEIVVQRGGTFVYLRHSTMP